MEALGTKVSHSRKPHPVLVRKTQGGLKGARTGELPGEVAWAKQMDT